MAIREASGDQHKFKNDSFESFSIVRVGLEPSVAKEKLSTRLGRWGGREPRLTADIPKSQCAIFACARKSFGMGRVPPQL